MKYGVNKMLVAGNLGRDPEVRFSEAGKAFCKLNIAVGERKKQGDEWIDHTEWVPAVCFGRTAENCGQYLSKGSEVILTGRMQTRKVEKDGQTRYYTEVVADNVTFVGGKGSSSSGGGEKRQQSKGQQQFADDLDDMPF